MVCKVPYGSSDDAFEDPTHVQMFFLNSFAYFSQPTYWRADYGYRGDWLINKITLIVPRQEYKGKPAEEILQDIHKYRNIVLEMIVELKAIKPIRKMERDLGTNFPIEIILTNHTIEKK
ncbi:hypothetical protein [Bacillus cereus]